VGPLIEDLVTRTSVTYANEPGSASYPAQLNQRPGAAAAISPHATVSCGQPEYVVNSALAVAAQAVANVARLRGIHAALHRELRQFWAVDRSSNSTRRRRAALETITHKLARLELDLAVAVEAPTDTGALVPS